MTDQQKISVLLAEIRQCINDDNLMAAQRKVMAIEEMLKVPAPPPPQPTVAQLREILAGDQDAEQADHTRQLLGLTTDNPAVVAVMGSQPPCQRYGCQLLKVTPPAPPQGQEPHEQQLVELVRDGLLETRILMLCPFGAGVSTVEYTHLSQVPSYWPCSCGAEHAFGAEAANIQFRLAASPPAQEQRPATFTKYRGDGTAPAPKDLSWCYYDSREVHLAAAPPAQGWQPPALTEQLIGQLHTMSREDLLEWIANLYRSLPAPPLAANQE